MTVRRNTIIAAVLVILAALLAVSLWRGRVTSTLGPFRSDPS